MDFLTIKNSALSSYFFAPLILGQNRVLRLQIDGQISTWKRFQSYRMFQRRRMMEPWFPFHGWPNVVLVLHETPDKGSYSWHFFVKCFFHRLKPPEVPNRSQKKEWVIVIEVFLGTYKVGNRDTTMTLRDLKRDLKGT